MERSGGIRGTFRSPDAPADIEEALEQLPMQVTRGFGTICFKASQFTDDARELGRLCRQVVGRAAELS
jgi:hypothetical protein